MTKIVLRQDSSNRNKIKRDKLFLCQQFLGEDGKGKKSQTYLRNPRSFPSLGICSFYFLCRRITGRGARAIITTLAITLIVSDSFIELSFVSGTSMFRWRSRSPSFQNTRINMINNAYLLGLHPLPSFGT